MSLYRKFCRSKTFLFALFALFPSAAFAQESFTYQPEYCDFIANFPEEPVISEKCESEDDDATCFKLVSFTKVIEMSSTVRVDIICNPASPEMFDFFQPEIMEKTVREMTKDTVIESYRVDSVTEENFRQTGLIGKAQKGLDDSLYLAQLWVSPHSIMSVEAELSGAHLEEADKLFATILGGIGHKETMEKDLAAQKSTQASPAPAQEEQGKD